MRQTASVWHQGSSGGNLFRLSEATLMIELPERALALYHLPLETSGGDAEGTGVFWQTQELGARL